MVFIPGTVPVPSTGPFQPVVSAPNLPGLPGTIPVPPFPTGTVSTVLTNDVTGVNGLSRIVATPTPVGLVNPRITAPTNDYVSLAGNFSLPTGGLWTLEGNDTVVASIGNQRILGNAGDDLLFGGNDQDKLAGGQGNDVLVGGLGNDLLLGNFDNDDLLGDQDDDTLRGGQGGDRLDGGSGNDWLFGDFGVDALTGSDGFDTFVIRANAPNPLAGVRYVNPNLPATSPNYVVFDPGIGPVDGSNPFAADVITDFNPQEDFLGLDSGLVYSNLRFDTGQNITGGISNDTVIYNNLNNTVLAVLEDYTLGINSFDVVTLTPFQQNLGSDFFGPYVDGTV